MEAPLLSTRDARPWQCYYIIPLFPHCTGQRGRGVDNASGAHRATDDDLFSVLLAPGLVDEYGTPASAGWSFRASTVCFFVASSTAPQGPLYSPSTCRRPSSHRRAGLDGRQQSSHPLFSQGPPWAWAHVPSFVSGPLTRGSVVQWKGTWQARA